MNQIKQTWSWMFLTIAFALLSTFAQAGPGKGHGHGYYKHRWHSGPRTVIVVPPRTVVKHVHADCDHYVYWHDRYGCHRKKRVKVVYVEPQPSFDLRIQDKNTSIRISG